MSKTHEILRRIYYQHTDFARWVHHSNYLSFAEQGRYEFLRERFGDFDYIMRTRHLNIVARHIDVSFHNPARLDDLLRIVTYIHSFGNSSFVIHSDMFVDDRSISNVYMTGVFVNTENFKPVRIPDDIKAQMA